MFCAKGFFDYCIEESCFANGQYENCIKLLYDYGYRTIAINQNLDLSSIEAESNKKKKKGEARTLSDPVPEPFVKPDVQKYEGLKVLNRLTIIFHSQDVLYKIMRSQTYKKYDILAALPTTVAATSYTCNTLEADIFCFNIDQKNSIRRTRKMYSQLLERGYHFEIPYTPAIEDRGKRKHIIMLAHQLHMMAKSRNVIISSAASNPNFIRGPYDVINLGAIFGLNEQQSKNATLFNGLRVYQNSVARRYGKSAMYVEHVEEEAEQNLEVIEIKGNDNEVVVLDETDDEMDTDQPVTKKLKQ